eukprot:9495350-Pyramimonas_sp.AAC.1
MGLAREAADTDVLRLRESAGLCSTPGPHPRAAQWASWGTLTGHVVARLDWPTLGYHCRSKAPFGCLWDDACLESDHGRGEWKHGGGEYQR